MRKLTSALAALALLATACGGGGSGGGAEVATVNGSPITVGDVESVPFTTSGSLATADFAQYLGAVIQWSILDDAADAEFGINPTDEEVATELETLISQLGGVTAAELAEQQNISEASLSKIARASLIQAAVGEELASGVETPTEAELDAARVAAGADTTEVCAMHLLVDTVEEAEAAKDRIEGGEDFSTVASEVSTDPSAADNGGDLGCAPAGNYVEPFRDASVEAEIDTLTDPVESQFGFHVIQVYDRTDPSAEDLPNDEELANQILQEQGSALLEEWSERIINEADVVVVEEYGTWSAALPGVVPPQT